MSPRRRKRLDPAAFRLPADALRGEVYAPATGLLVRDVLTADGRSPRVTVQIVAECAGVLCGVDEAIALLRLGVEPWDALAVSALYDGDRIDSGDAVMVIEGAFERFAHIAPLCLGVLARRTRVCTNARHLAEAARSKPVVALPVHGDHFLMHPGDALAAQIGGVHPLSGAAQRVGRNQPRLTSVPHALIAAYGGDTVAAVRACLEHVPREAMLVVPVDYENDAVRTSLAVARSQEARVWGVQLATSEHLVDLSILPEMGAFPPAGVNAPLVWNVRNALDAEGYGDIRILVSSEVTVERIRHFEEDGVPVDAYGVDVALLAGESGFLGDVVMLDGVPQSRAGRLPRPTSRLERVR